MNRRSSGREPHPRGHASDQPIGELRIIGGKLRGRVVPFLGGSHIRPMKDRVREAVFNLLADDVKGTHAIDLFAGTGALAFEAISRGATRATMLERHFPTARQMLKQAEMLEIGEKVQVESSDTFVWVRRFLEGTLSNPDGTPRPLLAEWSNQPWLVFCSPPYVLFVDRREDLLDLIGGLKRVAPPGSMLVVESDERFNPADLPEAEAWFTRAYPPAVISIWRCLRTS